MGAAPNSTSFSAPFMARLVADYVQLRQNGISGSSVDPNGPNGQLLAQLDKAFQPFLAKVFSDPQTASDQQAAMAAPVPTPYSTDGISPEVQSNPMSQLPPDTLNRLQNFNANSAVLANGYSTPNVVVRDHTAPTATVVRDHGSNSSIPWAPTVTYNAAGAATVNVRDHRHPEGPYYPPAAPPPGYYPPVASAPPVAAPPPPSTGSTSVTGTSFTSAADYQKVDQLNANFQAAKQDALNNPNDPSKQIAFQEAAQALQLMVNMLLQISQMLASIADKAISNSKVNPS